ncbi:MAG TPA: response regulator [Thermodesulfobacteriota bacterium]|nr:response regulator [Thermodesulfobacteriota bacterium]
MRRRGRAGRARVLVVECDPHVRRLERAFLEQQGFSVAFASDGREALAVAARRRPDVVVTEVLVPGLDGLALCRRLKAEPATAGIPVVVLSVLHVEARAREAGADAVLRKPLDDASLVATIQALLAGPSQAGPARRGRA